MKMFLIIIPFILRVDMDEYLSSVYYDSKRSGGFGGVDRLYNDVKKEGKFDISRAKIKEWLMKQDAYTLHKPIQRHFKRNRVIVGGIDQQWQMDLADMQSMQKFNDGFRYLLVCIDVFSKYAWVVPLKTRRVVHWWKRLRLFWPLDVNPKKS